MNLRTRMLSVWAHVALSALLLLWCLLALTGVSADHVRPEWPLVVVVFGFYVAMRWPVHIATDSGRHHVTVDLTEALVVVGCFLFDPAPFVIAAMFGALPAIARLRPPPVKFAVNLVHTGLWTAIPLLLFHLFAGASNGPSPRAVAVAVLAAGVSWLGSNLSIQIPIGLSTGRWRRNRGEIRELAVAALTGLGAAHIALVGVVIGATEPTLLTLLSLPLVHVILSNGRQIRNADSRHILEFTVGAAESLRLGIDTPQVLTDLLPDLRVAFGADEVSLLATVPGEVLRVVAHEDEVVRPGSLPVEGTLRSWLTDHASSGPATSETDASLVDIAGAMRRGELLVAPIPSDQGDAAFVLAGRRLGPFRPDHVRLIRTLASSASAALERYLLSQELNASEQHRVELEQRASHDAMTGLVNRPQLDRDLDSAFSDEGPVAMLYLDLNGFKAVNDNLGHAQGDAVLVHAAARIRAAIRPTDIAARLGGDEFAVLLPGGTEDDARRVGMRILELFGEPIPDLEAVDEIRAAVGVAERVAGDTPATLLGRADAAMYVAKRGSTISTLSG